MERKISIVIPCYNVEPYIDRCFESLVNQTIGFENIEVIFVNDASTDNTLDKLTSFEQQYPENILVINFEENRRQGTARNVALEYVSAPYVGFVDADDFVEHNMFEKMVDAIEKYDCDFVECRWDFAKSFQERKPSKKLGRDGYMDLRNPAVKEDFIASKIALVMSCDKVVRSSFLKDNDIFFPEQLRHEDFFFSYLIFTYAQTCYCLGDVLYHYYINPTSTVRQKKQEYHYDQMTVMLGFLQTCMERGLLVENPRNPMEIVNKTTIEWMFLEQYYVYMLWKIFEQFPERAYENYMEMKTTILEFVPEFKENPLRKYPGNEFDDFMIKLLEHDLDESAFLQLRDEMLAKFDVRDVQEF